MMSNIDQSGSKSNPVKEDDSSPIHQNAKLSPETISFFDYHRAQHLAITLDEVTLEDQPSDYHPNDVNLTTWITPNIKLKGCGIISAAMDTVTEKELALELARLGGIGIIHRNMDPMEQARMVQWVRQKINYGGMIDNPITFGPNQYLSDLQDAIIKHQYNFSSFPIANKDGVLLGLITRTELEFVEESNPKLESIMKPLNQLIIEYEPTDSHKAYETMRATRIKLLPIVNQKKVLQGMYVWNDVKHHQEKQRLFSLDKEGHFLVGAAVGFGNDEFERAKILIDIGQCKLLVLDSSHGSCTPCLDQIRRIREMFGNQVELIAGNIASYASAMYLLKSEYRPDALKVGIGPGSICTTRNVTGHGVPQLTAIHEVSRAVRDSGHFMPIIADGGIRMSGDIVKLIAAGASGFMLGSMLAGTTESPGTILIKDGKKFKAIRGMGSRSAMEQRSGSRNRYFLESSTVNRELQTLSQKQKEKVVPEGVEGLVEFKGPLFKVFNQIIGGVQSGLAHSGSKTIAEFQGKAKLCRQSMSGSLEGSPHDIFQVTH